MFLRLVKAFVRVIAVLVILGAIVFIGFNFYWSQQTQGHVFAEDEFTPPNRMPEVNVEYFGDATPGRITFTMSILGDGIQDFLQRDHWDHLIEYDTQLQQIVYAEQAFFSATNFERHSETLSSYYHYPFWQGQVANDLGLLSGGILGVSGGEFIFLDENYKEVRRIGQTWNSDLHEIHVLENGNILYFGAVVRNEGESYLGCDSNCFSVSQPIYEINPDGEIVWEWDVYDYYDAELTVNPVVWQMTGPSLQAINISDNYHANSIAVAPDGDYIVSVRHYSDVFKLDPETGEVEWHLGNSESPYNQFEFINDPYNGVSFQHTASILENGNVLIFDNGNEHEPPVSRAVEYELDLDAMTATLVWSYVTPEEHFSRFAGSAERLANGNTLINFTQRQPAFVEVTADGEVVMQVSFDPPEYFAYRAQFYPWYGESE